jgi:alpha-L-rhamnosidase
MVRRLQSNIEWGQRGNFLEVPTDCPQRDERLGWTGDAQVFVRTACWNADTGGFFAKWLQDLADTQGDDGAVGDVAPLVRPELFSLAAPGWGDAAVMVPWDLHRVYGDQRLLERCYPMMAGWVDYVHAANPDHLWLESRGMDYGDWLSIEAETPKDLLASAFYAHSCDLVGRAADVLGRKEDRDRYIELFGDVRAAFNDAYVTPSGRMVGHQQAAYALALSFDLLPEDKRAAAAGFLVEDIRARGTHLSTGFLGVAHLLPVLTRFGHLDVAYELLHQDTFPSWGYSIRHGATTIWERWDGWTAERGFMAHEMNSFNHYALGSVGEWLYGVAAGLGQPDGGVGFERIRVAPRPGGRLTSAAALYRSIRGTVRSAWELSGSTLRLDVDVPPNVTAEVVVPGARPAHVRESGLALDRVDALHSLSDTELGTVCVIGSGSYRFTADVSACRLSGSADGSLQ